MNYLQAEGITKSYGDLVLYNGISLSVEKEQRVAIIANNGAGKTSLLRILAGADTPDSGSVTIRNDLRLGYLEQSPKLNPELTVIEEVFESSDVTLQTIKEYEMACRDNNTERLANATSAMDAAKAWNYEARIKQILSQLNINNFEQKVGQLSGGQKKRLALAKTLIDDPDILILDEPTNHLDLNMIEWLEAFLNSSKSTLIMVTHDRYFLDRVCDIIYEIDDKQIFKYRGNYSYFLAKREERIYNQNSEIEKARQLYKKELDWIRRMPQARGTKAKYRIDAFEDIKGTAFKNTRSESMQIDIKSSRLGTKIIDLFSIDKRFGDKVLLNDFTYQFRRGEKIGVVGANGAGKTTLLNIITGNEPYDRGRIEIGTTIKIGYYKQEEVSFDENKRVIEVIQDVAEDIAVGEGTRLSPTQFLNYFLFPHQMHYAYVSKLSGGERKRLYLMTVLMRNPNFLILDEPTNDLDIVTLNVLEDYLSKYDGCVLIVSHDRFFMDKVVDHLFVFEGDGKIKDYPGNYTQYRDWKNSQAKAETAAAKPEQSLQKPRERTEAKHRMTFKERKEFEQLETEIEQLETEKSQIEAALSGGESDAKKITELSTRFDEVSRLLDEKSDRWIELSEIES
ncbi:MAG: ABC-F family ATP-binding cassette domain-containing protein [Salinivirgaceae bacterium]|nr:ABC-F family ATP-binding cassette domain-containing protein [Salinivirgaceae bacterium]